MSSVEERIADLNAQIDACDAEIRQIIGDRNDLDCALQSLRKANGLPVWDQKRADEVIDGYQDELGEIDGIKIGTAIHGTQDVIEALAD